MGSSDATGPPGRTLAAGTVVLCLLGIVVYFGGRQFGYFGASHGRLAPNVVGLQLHAAEAVVTQHGLRYTITPHYSGKPKDEVVSEQPGPGADVNFTVNLTYSGGREPLAMPNTIGEENNRAVAALEAHGFRVVLRTARPTKADQPQGTVIHQSPEPHTMDEPGTLVTLTYVKA